MILFLVLSFAWCLFATTLAAGLMRAAARRELPMAPGFIARVDRGEQAETTTGSTSFLTLNPQLFH